MNQLFGAAAAAAVAAASAVNLGTTTNTNQSNTNANSATNSNFETIPTTLSFAQQLNAASHLIAATLLQQQQKNW